MPTNQLLQQVQQAATDGHLTPSAAKNIRAWLTEPRYAEYVPEVAEHISDQRWKQLDDVFWNIIPFGTGGRRGRMYPIGSGAINDRTIGESALGLANYVQSVTGVQSVLGVHSQLGSDANLSCAVAYDTRHRSRHFAQLCAEIMVASGFHVYFLDGHRSTPELSYTVRAKGCSCGIMVTASHNPPSDNAVKVYWSTGGQICPPHDQGVIERVMSASLFERVPFEKGIADGRIECCQEEMDTGFVDAVASLSQLDPHDTSPHSYHVIYSPLHGVGSTAVCPVLAKARFDQVELFGPHAEPDGDFPNVPGHVSNPENPRVFEAIIDHARQVGADLAVASDPDCDRIGCAAPILPSTNDRSETHQEWATLTGNQIGALLADFLLEARKAQRSLTPKHYVVKTLVTTELIRRIADHYGVRTLGNLLVGFKWIGQAIDDHDPEYFVFGTEESHGYLAGTHARDKDGAVAAMLLCELAANLKSEGQTLHGKLDALFLRHGAHAERTVSVRMPGSEGMARMQELMATFRTTHPSQFPEVEVRQVRDYLEQTVRQADGGPHPLEGPRGDLIILDLQPGGNTIAIRPSGTEPKIKLYMFVYEPPEQIADLDAAKAELQERLNTMETAMRRFAGV